VWLAFCCRERVQMKTPSRDRHPRCEGIPKEIVVLNRGFSIWQIESCRVDTVTERALLNPKRQGITWIWMDQRSGTCRMTTPAGFVCNHGRSVSLLEVTC
jgi:hypothetical protein